MKIYTKENPVFYDLLTLHVPQLCKLQTTVLRKTTKLPIHWSSEMSN